MSMFFKPLNTPCRWPIDFFLVVMGSKNDTDTEIFFQYEFQIVKVDGASGRLHRHLHAGSQMKHVKRPIQPLGDFIHQFDFWDTKTGTVSAIRHSDQFYVVVSSKLAPIPPEVQSALDALRTQRSGLVFTATMPDGTTTDVSQGQVVAHVLQHLRSQVQLVVGKAVRIEDLRKFLKSQKVEP